MTIRTDRRDFLLHAGMLGAATLVRAPESRSKVVIATDSHLRAGGRSVDANRLLTLLDQSIVALFGTADAVEAWKRVVRPGEVVGLKVNCLAGRNLSTTRALVNSVVERLGGAGIRPADIVVWDRDSEDLEEAGFPIAEHAGRMRVLGNDRGGFEPDLAVFGSAGSLLSRTLTRLCDVVINMPVLKDHGIAGVTMALKNMFGAVHNPNKYHSNVGDPYIPDVYMLGPVRQKARLHICDATTAQYEGGPPFMPRWAWSCNSLLLSTDPVALDYVGWQMIEKKRAESGMKSLEQVGRKPSYIMTAADSAHRIGIADPGRIDVVKV